MNNTKYNYYRSSQISQNAKSHPKYIYIECDDYNKCINCKHNKNRDNNILYQSVLSTIPIIIEQKSYQNIIYVPIINTNNINTEYSLVFDVDNSNSVLQARIIDVESGAIVGNLAASISGFNYVKLQINDFKSHRLSVEVKSMGLSSPTIYTITLIASSIKNMPLQHDHC